MERPFILNSPPAAERVRAPRVTLLGAFVAALALVAALLAALAALILENSRRSILAACLPDSIRFRCLQP